MHHWLSGKVSDSKAVTWLWCPLSPCSFIQNKPYWWLKKRCLRGFLPGAWHYRLSTGTGWPSITILWLGEMRSLICSFCFREEAWKLVYAGSPLDTLVCWTDVKQPTNNYFLSTIITSCHPAYQAHLICNFYFSVAAHTIAWADLSLRHTSMLLGY